MDIVKFDDLEQVSCLMHLYATEFNESSTVTLFYKEASELLRELLEFNDVKIGYINIEDDDKYDYQKEYYVTLFWDDLSVCVEQAWNDSKDSYLEASTNMVLLHECVNSKIALTNPNANLYELRFSEDDCCDCCDCCDFCNEECDDDECDDDECAYELYKDICDHIYNILERIKELKIALERNE